MPMPSKKEEHVFRGTGYVRQVLMDPIPSNLSPEDYLKAREEQRKRLWDEHAEWVYFNEINIKDDETAKRRAMKEVMETTR